MLLVEEALFFLGLVPMHSRGESQTFYRCNQCGNRFAEALDVPLDFGDSSDIPKWECRRCGEWNPNTRFTCKKCGRRV
jgi:hypothetical protein